jgi:hypothetical protein
LRHPSDAVVAKVAADVALFGHARSATPVPWLDVSLQVGRVRRAVRVFGDRRWRREEGWRASDPAPFTKMPLGFEHAFGGWDRRHADPARHAADLRNPLGRGFLVDPRDAEGVPLPNLEDPDALIRSPSDAPAPAGLGRAASASRSAAAAPTSRSISPTCAWSSPSPCAMSRRGARPSCSTR